MYTETIPVNVAAVVATVAAADALGEALGDGQQSSRDQLREDIRQTVREAVQGAREGAADAGRAAADAQRIAAELDRARQEVGRLQVQEGGGNVSITRDGNNVVIRTADGKTITIDQSVVPPQAIEGLVASLSPPPMPPMLPGDGGPPESVIRLTSTVFICLTVMVMFWTLARALGRRADRKAAQGGGLAPDVALRLERIEQAVDAMAVEMERVSEAQRYSVRLLTERLPESWQQLAAAPAAQRAGQTTP
jgi:hypothetical protein